jgi:hypothetical protein
MGVHCNELPTDFLHQRGADLYTPFAIELTSCCVDIPGEGVVERAA